MGNTVVSDDGRFEWKKKKDRDNIKNHQFHISEITEVFDDPDFIYEYDSGHSSIETEDYDDNFKKTHG